MDCTSEKGVCEKAEVRGYPTLKAYYGGKELDTHQGQRDMQALKKFTARFRPC